MLISGLLNSFIPAKNSSDGQELVREDEFCGFFLGGTTVRISAM